MHPEVSNYILLFAISSFIFYSLNITKKEIGISIEAKQIFSQDSQSDNEHVKLISEHVPTHLKPKSNKEFGHYLAGLIDGDGWFSKYAVHIVFNGLDASLAYYIKGRIGYGTVAKINSKNAVLLTITKREGLQIVLNLINGKLRTQFKQDAVYRYILNVYKTSLDLKEKFHLNIGSDTDNH